MLRFRTFWNWLIEVITWGSRISLFATMLLITCDIVTRMFSASIVGVHEISAASLILLVFLALAYVETRDEYIRVRFIIERLGKRTQSAMKAIMTLVMMAFFCVMIWQTISYALDALRVGLTYDTIGWPIFPFRFVIPVGLLFLTLQLIPRLVTSIRGSIRSTSRNEIN